MRVPRRRRRGDRFRNLERAVYRVWCWYLARTGRVPRADQPLHPSERVVMHASAGRGLGTVCGYQHGPADTSGVTQDIWNVTCTECSRIVFAAEQYPPIVDDD